MRKLSEDGTDAGCKYVMRSVIYVTTAFLLVTVLPGRNCQTTSTTMAEQKCSYNFVVPDPDLLDTCQAFANKQIARLREQVTDLQDKLVNMSGGQSARNLSEALNLQFQCGCNNQTSFAFTYRDCQDVKVLTDGVSGVYEIEPIKSTGQLIQVEQRTPSSPANQRYWVTTTWGAIKVPCNLDDEDIGWTILMRRTKMDVSFDRDWYDYKIGFGNQKNGDFWLGLENIYRITNQMIARYTMWLVLTDESNVPHVYPYGKFWLEDEEEDYMLHAEDYHGTLRNTFSSNRPFVAKDHPNKASSRYGKINCASDSSNNGGLGTGGWWFTQDGVRYSYYGSYRCGYGNLFASTPKWEGISNVTSVEMKIRQGE